jgi:hypothetical protein
VEFLGEVVDDELRLNPFGQIVESAWFDLPRHYPNVELGAFVVMPNHVHGIIVLQDASRGGSVPTKAPGPVSKVVSQDTRPEIPKTHPYRLI